MDDLRKRPRRLRYSKGVRALVSETHLEASQLVLPCFVREGKGIEIPVTSMPGVSQYSVDRLLSEIDPLLSKGLNAVMLFGIPDRKDATGSGAWSDRGPVPEAIRALKRSYPDMVVIADVCLCEYTSHGHCGPVEKNSGGNVDNDEACRLYAKIAVAYSRAGADMVAPSGMMDGMVAAIREALDDDDRHETSIMAYSAKYASSFYGPFRDAAESPPLFGDRKSYQMDPANATEAMREIALDINEGADIVMVKPALPYLDIIRRARKKFDVPIAAYNVSGEYSMIMAAIEKGWLSRDVIHESLLSIKRAGANIIITYFVKELLGVHGNHQ